MRRITLLALLAVAMLCASAQNASEARKVLDKTASIVGNKGGATASFKVSGTGIVATSGTISIKGSKFQARAGEAIVWYDGKTQWSYLRSTNEVSVTTPTEAQRARMNPYALITMYKSGYNLGMTTKGDDYQVHMTANNKQRDVQEAYLTIDRRTYTPGTIKVRSGGKWTTITVSNFQKKNLAESTFAFNAKAFPKAEVVDLR